MPSGAKKRKAAKKKKANGSSTPNSHQGENDGGELNSPTSPYPSVEVEKRSDSSSENKSKDVNEEQGHIDNEVGSKSKSSNGGSSSSNDSSDDESRVVEKNVVVLEPAPEKVYPVVDPVTPVDSLLEEVSQVFDGIKNEKKKELVVEEVPVAVEEQTVVVSEAAIEDDCATSSVVVESVIKENEVEKVISSDENASSVSKDYVPSSTPPENLISYEVNGAERANESDTIEHSSRQAPPASAAVTVQRTTTWKSCCGIFELFSGSER